MTKVLCRCGATELEITAEPIVQFYCHCDDCQAVHGGAYAPESVYPADAVKVVRGDPTTWRLKRNPRFTCRECGTRLFIDVEAKRLRGVNGYLLPPGKGSVHGRGVIFGGLGGGKTRRSGSGAGVVTAAGCLGWSCWTSH